MRYAKVTASLTALLLFATLFIYISCKPGAAPSTQQQGQAPTLEKELPKSVPRGGWEEKWETTLQAAKKEGSVVIYASSVAPALKDSMKIIKQKFGLDLDIVGGRGSELRGKLLQERNNGLFIVDVFVSGANTIFGSVKSAGVAEPLAPVLMLPEVLDPKAWYEGQVPFIDEDKKVFRMYAYPVNSIAINSTMVKADEIKSYYDLLDPKWKGKVMINDPTVTGIGFNGMSGLLFNKVVDLDFFKQLVSQQTTMLRDQRLQVDWLARGRFPVALWARSVHMAEFGQAGAPVAYAYPKEGTYLSSNGGNVVLVNRAPHPNAARIFINWLLSKEGQSMMQDGLLQQSARADIPTSAIDADSLRRPGAKYLQDVNDSEKWIMEEQDRYLSMAREAFMALSR